MLKNEKIWMSKNETEQYLLPKMANRHGLIAGATGTGKTITLKVMAESFSNLGVPVFLADIKGDLSGMCSHGESNENMSKRIAKFSIDDFEYTSFPTRFFDVFGKNGHPVRTTVSEMGPILLSRLLGLTPVQEGVLNIVFRVADDNGLLLIDLKDLKTMLHYVAEHKEEYTLTYGNVTPQSAGAIQRSLLALESQGADLFFGEPAFDIMDWFTTDEKGRGMINILDSTELVHSPILYATFLLWLLTELFEQLPEVGDAEKPKFVFFFDEAHLLFRDMPKALNQKIEQVVKLIRSKGVGVYFITQSPSDIPDEVLAQLGNRIQHALRAYTPAEQRAVKTAAMTFRQNEKFDTAEAIMELGVGEALVSFLDEQGIPTMVERTFILPPQSLMGPIDSYTRNRMITQSPLDEKYGTSVDNLSAYEVLTEKDEAAAAEEKKKQEELALGKQKEKEEAEQKKKKEKEEAELKKKKEKEEAAKEKKKARTREKLIDKTVGRAASSAFGQIGRELGKSILRGLFGTKK